MKYNITSYYEEKLSGVLVEIIDKNTKKGCAFVLYKENDKHLFIDEIRKRFNLSTVKAKLLLDKVKYEI